ncbi:unnamed protein product, partial [Amoebophrya sp. A120]
YHLASISSQTPKSSSFLINSPIMQPPRRKCACLFLLLVSAFPSSAVSDAAFASRRNGDDRHVTLSVAAKAKWVHPAFERHTTHQCPVVSSGRRAPASAKNFLTCEYVPLKTNGSKKLPDLSSPASNKTAFFGELATRDILIFSCGDAFDVSEYQEYVAQKEKDEKKEPQLWAVAHRENSMRPNNLLEKFFAPPEKFKRVVSIFSDPRATVLWSDLYFLPRPKNPAKQKMVELQLAHSVGGHASTSTSSQEELLSEMLTTTTTRDYVPLPSFLTFLDTPTYEEIEQRLARQKEAKLQAAGEDHHDDQDHQQELPVLYISRKFGMSSNRDYWARGLQKQKRLHSRGECFLRSEKDYMDPVIRRKNSLKMDWLERYRDPRYYKQVDVSGRSLVAEDADNDLQEFALSDASSASSTTTFSSSKKNATTTAFRAPLYKFYLSGHNTNCRHYADEKLVKPFFHGLVPVVVGVSREDLVLVTPQNSFIHVDDFENVEVLGQYLDYLSQNDTAYLEYHQWRKVVDLVDYKNDKFPCAFCQAVVASREGGANQELNPWAVHHEMLRERLRQTAATASTSVGGVVDNLDANLHCMVDGLLRNGSFSHCPAGGRRRPMDPFVRGSDNEQKAENEKASEPSTEIDTERYWSELDFARQANDEIRPDETRPDWEWRRQRQSTTAATQEEERPIKSSEPSSSGVVQNSSRLRAQQERFDRAFSTKDARFPQGYAVYEDDKDEEPEFAREWAVMRDDDCVPAAWDGVEGQEDAEMKRENRLSSQNEDSSELHVDDVEYQATPLPRNKPDEQAGATGQQEIKRVSSQDEDEEANFYEVDQNQFPF